VLICALIAVLSVLTIPGCRNRTPSRNPVKSIDVSAMDTIIRAPSFSGVVAVIASWCPPCREELPVLGKLYRRYGARGIQIVALSIDADGTGALQSVIDESGVEFPVYRVGRQGISHYNIIGVPMLWIVRNGRIIEKMPGRQTRSSIEKRINRLSASKPDKGASLPSLLRAL
jgi:thiol-disulfide isomerase/thioredoxin